MKTAVLYEVKTPLKIEETDLEEPGVGDVMVKVMASGVCHSDWHVIKGDWPQVKLPVVLGHEAAGVVEAVGPGVAGVQPGDHVILSFRTNCGTCELCSKGFPMLCDRPPITRNRPKLRSTGKALGVLAGVGSFSPYVIVPEVAAVPIDKDIPFPQAALVGCGVMTGVGAVLNTAKVEPGSTVAVFGCGGVGLNCIQGAVLANADTIIAVDVLDNKLQMGREFGATHTVNASKEDPVAKIREITGGAGVHYAFEAVGLIGEIFLQSVECTRKRGLTVWVGAAPVNTPVTLDARMLIPEKMIIGNVYGTARPHVDFPKLLRMYKQGKLKLDELVTRVYSLEEVNTAFDALSKGEVARSVISYE